MKKIRLFLLYSFPLVLYFSYYPILPLFSSASTNYELSLPLIWLFLFSVLSLKDFIYYIYNIYKATKVSLDSKHYSLKLKLFLPFAPLLFLLYLSLSVLWSSNPVRGLLTAGIAWCLYISSVVILTTFSGKTPKIQFNKSLFLKIFLLSAVGVSLVCWLQSVFDVFDVARETTLLCRGCTSQIFGFPHPSGFAIEPQFMGNLLLAPTLTSLYLLFSRENKFENLFPRKILVLISFILLATLFLVFSRGAIYSFFVSFALLLVLNLFKLKNKSFLKSLPLVFLAFFFSLLSQGFFASVNKNYEKSFSCAVSASLSQLSLDMINLPCEETSVSSEVSDSVENLAAAESPATPAYSGYIAESTDVRLELNRSALEVASESNLPWFFGYGLGSAGTVLKEKGKTDSKKEIVQNEYLSLLLETGVVGLLLFFAVIFTTISFAKTASPETPPVLYLFYAVVLSFLLSLLFFSGLPNALHLYLFPVFLLLVFFDRPLPENKSVINQKVKHHHNRHH